MAKVDFTTDFGQRARQRLEDEHLVWLTTTKVDGTPQPSLVWFVYEDAGTVLIYSQPQAPKVKAIHRNPNVALSFNSNAQGGDVLVFNGTASIVDEVLAKDHPRYVEKFGARIERMPMTPESFSETYSQAIRVVPTAMRGF